MGTPAGGKVAEELKVTGAPTILFLTSKGKEISRYGQFIPAPEFAKNMQAALAKAK